MAWLKLVKENVIPDGRGRINLGNLAHDISKFNIFRDKEGRFILEPYVDIPLREAWLYKNKQALKSVRKGMQESLEGKLKKLDLDTLGE